MKRNASYVVIRRNPIAWRSNVIKDEIIRQQGIKGPLKCHYDLRRIEVWDQERDVVLVFLTNHLKLAATTIAAIYKDRWQIEIFFKALKQNLKIKTFVGTSPNAVRIQIWTALIAMLLLRYLQLLSKFKWSLSNLVALLRMNLFTHKDLWAWLHKPFEVIEEPDAPEQLVLNLT
jgi:IS4 transposase